MLKMPPDTCPAFPFPIPFLEPPPTTTRPWTWAIPSVVSAVFLTSTLYASFRARAFARHLRNSEIENARLRSKIAELESGINAEKEEEKRRRIKEEEQSRERELEQEQQERGRQQQFETLTSELSALRVQHTLLSERTLEFEILSTQKEDEGDEGVEEVSEDQAVSLLEAMNTSIAHLGAGLAEEGAKIVTELEGALEDAKATSVWVESMERERDKERGGTQVDADHTGGGTMFEHAAGSMPMTTPQTAASVHRVSATHRSNTQVYFPEHRLTDSPASLHEVELPLAAAPLAPFSSHMYPYPYSNQQQPMGIPLSMPASRPSASTSTSSSASASATHTLSKSITRSQQHLPSSTAASSSPYNMQKAIHAQREKLEAENAAMREEVDEATGQAVEVFGERFVGLLRGVVEDSSYPTGELREQGTKRILNLAFRTALCAYTHWMVCSWFFEDGSTEGENHHGRGDGADGEGLEGFLGEVYARVREGEEQLASGKWRAITRKHVQRMLPGNSRTSSMSESHPESNIEQQAEDRLLEELCVYIIDALVNVLIVAGVHGGWYLDGSLPPSSSSSTASLPSEGVFEPLEGGDAGYVDVYHDPYEGYSISQLSEFLAVTPTSATFSVGDMGAPRSHRGGAPGVRVQSPAQARAQQEAFRESTKKYTHTHLHALLTAKFKPELVKILKQAKELNKALGEGVVKCDLEALYVAPGVGYESGTMISGESGIKAAEEEEKEVVGQREEQIQKTKEEESEDEIEEGDDGDETPRTGGSPNVNSPVPPQYRGEMNLEKRRREQQQQHSHPMYREREQQEREEPRAEDEDIGHELEVLCTTDLGLVRAEKIPKTRGEWDEVVLVKPRVVLVGEIIGHTRSRVQRV